VLTGGADIHPDTYGEPAAAKRWPGDHVRDECELALLELATRRACPVLGVCRGLQLLNVARGGTLYQDLPTQRPGLTSHRDGARYDHLTHDVRVAPGSWVHRVYGRESLVVNSVHHQAVKTLGEGLRATAWAPDGLIEGIESRPDEPFLVGVQWHPEWLTTNRVYAAPPDGSTAGDRSVGDLLFSAYIDELRRRARRGASARAEP
jgi:putative glutamine amidotransferase